MSTEHDHFTSMLEAREIKPTANRLLVLRTLEEEDCALSLTDIEARIGTMDKSSVFRALTLFLEHHLVHGVDDGTGMMKYALCEPSCHCGENGHHDVSDYHTHFRCERCGRTFCLRGLPVPSVPLPKGFVLSSANYVLVGLCPHCSHVRE